MTSLATSAREDGTRRRRVRHPARWVAGALLVVLVVVAIVAATRPSYQATQVASPLITRPAPPISGTTVTGQHFSLSSYRGRYVYVNFFASWCPPCQQEEPNLIDFAFHEQQTTDGAAMVSVVFNDSVAAARRFVTRWGAEWPAVEDTAGAIANAYGVESPPMTFLVDPHGRVVGTWAGPVTTTQLEAMLASARHHQRLEGNG